MLAANKSVVPNPCCFHSSSVHYIKWEKIELGGGGGSICEILVFTVVCTLDVALYPLFGQKRLTHLGVDPGVNRLNLKSCYHKKPETILAYIIKS